MMNRPDRLDRWDFGDTVQVPDGYDMKSIPDITRGNFQKLIDEHNNLVDVVNKLIEISPAGSIVFDDLDQQA